ncbi:MAG: SDR family oxidoreductase, partial [Flavobacteriales bacterium]|nr:SDR family oxidoreductase [Flavobacteriales bacterium]
PYAESKLQGEYLLQKLGNENKFRFITCRFGTICGVSPGMRFHTAVNKFCWQAVNGQPLTVWRTAMHQKRPYLTLQDAVNAMIFIIKKNLFDQNTYNVLTDNLTVESIINMIEEQIPDLQIEYVETEIMNQLSYHVLNHKFNDQGFEVIGNIRENIHSTLEILNGVSTKSLVK